MPRASASLAMVGLLATTMFYSRSASASTESDCPRPCVRKLRVGGSCDSLERPNFDEVDHCLFDDLLRRFVDCNGRVCYRAWKRDCAAVDRLHTYLVSLGGVDALDPTASRAGKLAYYINAYNALVLWGILEEYPTASIQRHNRKGAEYRIFEDLELWIDGEYLSLNDIEHGVLRTLEEPRIHFALVCAARGCPRLRNEAYVADRLDEQLTDNALEFFSHRNRFRVCRHTGTVRLSPILKWFAEDFGVCDAEVLLAIAPWVPCRDRQWLLCNPCARIKYSGYNWALNDDCPMLAVRLGALPYCLYGGFEPFLKRFPFVATDEAASESSPDASHAPKTTPADSQPTLPAAALQPVPAKP